MTPKKVELFDYLENDEVNREVRIRGTGAKPGFVQKKEETFKIMEDAKKALNITETVYSTESSSSYTDTDSDVEDGLPMPKEALDFFKNTTKNKNLTASISAKSFDGKSIKSGFLLSKIKKLTPLELEIQKKESKKREFEEAKNEKPWTPDMKDEKTG